MTKEEREQRDLATRKAMHLLQNGTEDEKDAARTILAIVALDAPGIEDFSNQDERDLDLERKLIDTFLVTGMLGR